MVEGASYIMLITRTGQTGLWCDFVHSRLLLVQCRQARCAIVESASYTQTYYSYNTDKRDVRLLSALYPCAYYSYNADKPDVRWLRTLRTLTLITYNTDKANVRLLRVLSTLTLITRTVQTSLFHDYWARFAHLRLLLVQHRQAWCAIVESA